MISDLLTTPVALFVSSHTTRSPMRRLERAAAAFRSDVSRVIATRRAAVTERKVSIRMKVLLLASFPAAAAIYHELRRPGTVAEGLGLPIHSRAELNHPHDT